MLTPNYRVEKEDYRQFPTGHVKEYSTAFAQWNSNR